MKIKNQEVHSGHVGVAIAVLGWFVTGVGYIMAWKRAGKEDKNTDTKTS